MHTIAPAPSWGVAYGAFAGVKPGWDTPVAVAEDCIWDSECFCCSFTSLLSAQQFSEAIKSYIRDVYVCNITPKGR